jgi:hypothetical protein
VSAPWNVLWVFPAISIVAFVGAVIIARLQQPPLSLSAPLALDASWTPGASVTSITALGGILTAIFGASGAGSFLLGGDKAAQPAIAVATVGAAIALAFVSAGPLLLGIFTKNGHVTGFGILAAGSATLAAAIGELIVVARAVAKPGVGNDLHMVWVGAAVGATLLLLYAYRTALATIRVAAPPTPLETHVQVLEELLERPGTTPAARHAVTALRDAALAAPPPSRTPRRSALL